MVEYLTGNLEQDVPLTGETLLINFNEATQEAASRFEFRNPIQPQTSALQDLETEIENCAKSLVAVGLEKGNRVGVYEATVNEWIVLYGAAQKIGVELINVGREFSSEETMLYLNKNKCRVLFASANARIYLKDLVAAFSDNKVVGLSTEFIVLFEQKESAGINNLITYEAFKNLAKYTSDWELNRLRKLAQ